MRKELERLIREQSEFKDEITNDQCLYDDIGIDSLSIVDLIFQVEKAFNISFLESEVKEIKTVDHLINQVKSKINK
jgi:acyl carrier protein